MRNMRMALLFLSIASFFGCSTIQVNMHAVGVKPPLCRNAVANQKILVLWGTAWRGNQKEPNRREQVASAVIPRFFSETSCFASAFVHKLVGGRDPITMSDYEILKSDLVVAGGFQKIVVLRLEELGPTLVFSLSPALWAGSTNVALRVRVLDVSTSALDSDVAMDWNKGGAYVIRGAKYFEGSLIAALEAIF